MQGVSFNYTPSDIRVPLFYAELNAGTPPYSGVSRTLLIGRSSSTAGSAAQGVAVQLGSQDPVALFGPGTMLAEMAVIARWHNPTGAIWALPIPDSYYTSPGSATGSISFTGTATQAGTFTRYIAGRAYSCGVALGDTATTVANNWLAAVNAGYTLYNRQMAAPVTAAIDGSHVYQVDLTARHPGPEGNSIRIEAGVIGNEVDPAGITATITAMTGGTATLSFAEVLADLGSQKFDWIVGPYSTTQNLNDVQSFLADSGSGRWSPTVGLGGHYITYNDGNLSAQTSLGTARNDKHTTIIVGNQYPQAPWAWAAAWGGIVGLSKNLGAFLSDAVEIARPLQTLQLQGFNPPASRSNEWALSDRQALYTSGMAAMTFGADGTPQIDRACTTYQTNPAGAADITFLDLETLACSAYNIAYLKNLILTTYPRCVLLDSNPGNLQGVATPAQIKSTIINGYTDLCNIGGTAQNAALFAQYLIVDTDTDPSRVDVYLPENVANQLRIVAVNNTVFQQLDANVGSGLVA